MHMYIIYPQHDYGKKDIETHTPYVHVHKVKDRHLASSSLFVLMHMHLIIIMSLYCIHVYLIQYIQSTRRK